MHAPLIQSNKDILRIDDVPPMFQSLSIETTRTSVWGMGLIIIMVVGGSNMFRDALKKVSNKEIKVQQ